MKKFLLIALFTAFVSAEPLSTGAQKIEPFSVPPMILTNQDANKTQDSQESTTKDSTNTQNDQESKMESATDIIITDDGLSLKDLVESAKQNLNLEVKDLAILQARAAQIAAYGEFLPSVDASYQWQDSSNDYQKIRSQSATARANLEIFSGLKTLNKALEKSALYHASIADKADTYEQILLSLIQTYFGYFNHASNFASLNQKINQLSESKKRAESLYNAGLTTLDNLESINAELASAQYSLETTRLELEKSRLLLELISNTEISKIKRTALITPRLDADAVSERQDIIKLEYQTKAAKNAAAQITYLPTIALFDNYTWSKMDEFKAGPKGDIALKAFAERSFAPQNVFGISVSMRIFDGGVIYNSAESARLAYLQSQKALAYKRAEQAKDIKVYAKSLEISQSKIKAAKLALDAANTAFVNVQKKYQANILNFTDYLASMTRKFEAQAQFNAALNEHEIQKAFYIYYSGGKIADFIK